MQLTLQVGVAPQDLHSLSQRPPRPRGGDLRW